jgi:hypothetical protein
VPLFWHRHDSVSDTFLSRNNGSQTVYSQEVRLKHLEHLWSLLTEATNVDLFSRVDLSYMGALSFEEEEDMRLACDKALKLDILLPLLKNFIITQLTEQVRGLATVVMMMTPAAMMMMMMMMMMTMAIVVLSWPVIICLSTQRALVDKC